MDALGRNAQRANVTDTVSKLLQPGSLDELLGQAESERNKSMKELLYTRAVMSAAMGGDYDRALSIVEKLGDENHRAGFNSMIRLQATMAALKK